jgi:hypothetical protein
MATMPTGAKVGFRFLTQADFDLLVQKKTLVPGYWYLTDDSFYIAFDKDVYNTYGGGADVTEIVNEIIQNDLLQQEITNITNQITNNLTEEFTAALVEQITNEVKQQSITNITETVVVNVTEQIISNVTEQIIAAVTNQIITNVTQQIVDNSTQQVINNATSQIITNVTNQIIANVTQQIIDNIFQQIIDNTAEQVQDITNQVIANVTSQITSVAEQIVTDYTAQFTSTTEQIFLSKVSDFTEQIENITQTMITNATQSVINQSVQQIVDGSIQQVITEATQQVTNNVINAILSNPEIISQISGVVSLQAPDGSSISTNHNGVLTVQAAANDRFGIVKGQSNSTPLTWHNVSAANGLLSINREQLVAMIDSKDNVIKNAINVRAEDHCIVGRNENGVIVLPFRFVDTEPENPTSGTLYLIKEKDADTP